MHFIGTFHKQNNYFILNRTYKHSISAAFIGTTILWIFTHTYKHIITSLFIGTTLAFSSYVQRGTSFIHKQHFLTLIFFLFYLFLPGQYPKQEVPVFRFFSSTPINIYPPSWFSISFAKAHIVLMHSAGFQFLLYSILLDSISLVSELLNINALEAAKNINYTLGLGLDAERPANYLEINT